MVKLDFEKGKGMIPAVVQDVKTKEVIMLAYMNREALQKTLDSGNATYWSRSRNALWIKGKTSGNFQKVKKVSYDCDADALLLEVEQQGEGACHTGEFSCFYRKLTNKEELK
jgi:phosphoribosyl-AMP cyclohydrolase